MEGAKTHIYVDAPLSEHNLKSYFKLGLTFDGELQNKPNSFGGA
jgi:hypothetical protein